MNKERSSSAGGTANAPVLTSENGGRSDFLKRTGPGMVRIPMCVMRMGERPGGAILSRRKGRPSPATMPVCSDTAEAEAEAAARRTVAPISGGDAAHCQGRSGQCHYVLLHPAVLEYESSRSTTKTRVEPAGINGEGDCLP